MNDKDYDITKVHMRKGQTLTVECMVDGGSGMGFFLIKDEARGLVYKAQKVLGLGAHVEFDSDPNKLDTDGLEYQMYLTIREFVKDGKWGMDKGTLGNLGEVNYVLTKNLATYINGELGEGKFGGFTSMTIGKICGALGMRKFRLPQGYAVVLENKDLLAAGRRFDLSSAPGNDALAGND